MRNYAHLVEECFQLCSYLFSRGIISARNRSYGKVMFLHLSVSHSVHRGGWQTHPLGSHPPGQTHPLSRQPLPPRRHDPRQTLPWADTPWVDTPPRQTPWADTPPPETATAADGTYPTRMHSCSSYVYYLALQCFSYNINL